MNPLDRKDRTTASTMQLERKRLKSINYEFNNNNIKN